MFRGFFYLLIIVLCTVLFTGYGAKAQDESSGAIAPIFNSRREASAVPAKIRGNWAIPDCGKTYDEALIITGGFYLKSTLSEITFSPLKTLAEKNDYWVLGIDGKEVPVRREADGILKIGIVAGTPPKTWPKTWDSLHLDGRHEYMECKETPRIVPGPAIRLMRHIDKIAAACSAKTASGQCPRLLFNIADNNNSGKLSLTEMEMGGVLLTGLAALAENHTMSRTGLDMALYTGLAETEKIAPALLQGKGNLSYNDFSELKTGTDSEALEKSLISVGKIFPAFGKISLTPSQVDNNPLGAIPHPTPLPEGEGTKKNPTSPSPIGRGPG